MTEKRLDIKIDRFIERNEIRGKKIEARRLLIDERTISSIAM